ncbi:MarR family winged helix-turn-helix transcriptional regulator [Nocardia niigatensis]|uniref:MarR family winged helix-turn-helix transcriptional regulator n=1 Tax=Nocardia niigatensis TaxID=209249 RepID=UPI0002D87BA5|nr:MarR family winged helix-turn-helix transcriptional regulator [Nocardia niigatensis]
MTNGAARPAEPTNERARLETQLARDLRALSSVTELIGHAFARTNTLRPNDFRALLHVATADADSTPLTAGALGTLMGISPAAVTYLVERMISTGHLMRTVDTVDRRRVLLHYSEHGMAVAGEFFGPIGSRTRAAMADLPDTDLAAAHRVLSAAIAALRELSSELVAT